MENYFLSKEDLKLIVETLLYSASVDVCANWYKEDVSSMVELAKKIRSKEKVALENIYLFEKSQIGLYRDEVTENILNNFPELKFYIK
jgi:hypothetical protein